MQQARFSTGIQHHQRWLAVDVTQNGQQLRLSLTSGQRTQAWKREMSRGGRGSVTR